MLLRRDDGADGKVFFWGDCQLINIEKKVELENFNVALSKILSDSGKDHQWMLILLSEALLGNQVFTRSQYITSSHQSIKLSIVYSGRSWKYAALCMMQSKLYNVTHVIVLSKMLNLNLQTRKQSGKSQFGNILY